MLCSEYEDFSHVGLGVETYHDGLQHPLELRKILIGDLSQVGWICLIECFIGCKSKRKAWSIVTKQWLGMFLWILFAHINSYINCIGSYYKPLYGHNRPLFGLTSFDTINYLLKIKVKSTKELWGVGRPWTCLLKTYGNTHIC